MDVRFDNVTIIITGVASAEEAYDRLCKALASVENVDRLCEWTTDIYTAADQQPASTSELFPPPGSDRDLSA